MQASKVHWRQPLPAAARADVERARSLSVNDLRRFNPSLIFDYCDFHDFVWVSWCWRGGAAPAAGRRPSSADPADPQTNTQVPVDPSRVNDLVAPPSRETREINKKHLLLREFMLRCPGAQEMEAEFCTWPAARPHSLTPALRCAALAGAPARAADMSDHDGDVAAAVKHYKVPRAQRLRPAHTP
jgi:hypothetical protein